MKKIAVLMSSYNGEKYIKEQIDSILNQVGDFQIDLWVRDDGSKDSTINILETYSKEGRISWYSGENLGPANSFLDLIRHCRDYDYYAFSDQDDYWLPGKIKRGIETLSACDDMAIYFSNAYVVDEKLNSSGRCVYKKLPKTDFYSLTCAGGIIGCTMIFNNKMAERVYNYPMPSRIIMHDAYLSVLCRAFGGKIFYDENPLMKYRQHRNNVVGVSVGLFSTIINRFKSSFIPSKVSIAEQCESILDVFTDELSDDKKKWLQKVSKYRNRFTDRLKLALSGKPSYINFNKSFFLRLAIFLGNR